MERSWQLLAFHRKLVDWKAIALQVASRPTHLAGIVRREPTYVGFSDAYGLGAGNVWLNPAVTGHNLVWWHPCPVDVAAELLSSTKPKGTIANSDIELAALFLQEATLLKAVPMACMAAPRSDSDNTPTVSWSMCEASMINPAVADLLRIRALHSREFFFNPSVFYYPGQENCMADDASRLFSLSDIEFLTHVSVIHPQSHGLWQISLPPPELLTCVISTLRRKPCDTALLNMRDSRCYTGSGPTSVPPC